MIQRDTYLVVACKNMVNMVQSTMSAEEMVSQASSVIRSHECDSITKRAGLASVLTCGVIVDGIFMMPSTKKCLDNFRDVRRKLSKHKRLEVMRNDADEMSWIRI